MVPSEPTVNHLKPLAIKKGKAGIRILDFITRLFCGGRVCL